MPRTDILERKDEILQWISENQPKAFICRELKCKPETLNSYLQKMGIEYKGNMGGKGMKNDPSYKTAEEYILGTSVKSHVLKEKLIRDGIKERKCEICGNFQWQGFNLPLELHHKDGNHYNNNFDNLQILCPNCHSIQTGNGGANVGKYIEIKSFKEGENEEQSLLNNHCVDCGVIISKKAMRCKSCALRVRHKNSNSISLKPEREELKKLIRAIPFTQLGNKFNVSDNAIRKWCDSYNLPRSSAVIKKYTDKEWENI